MHIYFQWCPYYTTNPCYKENISTVAASSADTPRRVKKSLPRARLLTSDSCLAELQKKEVEKKQAAEEKERKKQAREEKRIQRLKILEEKKK